MSISLQMIAKMFPFPWRGQMAFAVVYGGILVGSARAASVTGENSHNGVSLFERDRFGFVTATGVVRDSIAEGPALAHPSLGPSAEIVSTGTILPDPPVTPGDEARIDALTRFEFGTPIGTVPHDRWTFRIEGTASAVDAQLGGEPADAIVRAFASAEFFIDPLTAPAPTTIGQVVVDTIRPLSEKEAELGASINFWLFKDGVSVLELGAGAPATEYPLMVGSHYKLEAAYYLDVPAGTDPPFLVELGATLMGHTRVLDFLGDLNGDGVVNFADLCPFTKALTDLAAYEAMFPNLDRVARCDTSGDGKCNFGDLAPFVGLLTGGPANVSAVPEPSTAVLLIGLGFASALAGRRSAATALCGQKYVRR
jgi:hypothetical protein